MEHQADVMHGDLNSHLSECSKKVSGGRCCEVGVYGDGAGGAGCGGVGTQLTEGTGQSLLPLVGQKVSSCEPRRREQGRNCS